MAILDMAIDFKGIIAIVVMRILVKMKTPVLRYVCQEGRGVGGGGGLRRGKGVGGGGVEAKREGGWGGGVEACRPRVVVGGWVGGIF